MAFVVCKHWEGAEGEKRFSLAVDTGIEDSLPFISWTHLSGVVRHSLMTTSRASPVNLERNRWLWKPSNNNSAFLQQLDCYNPSPPPPRAFCRNGVQNQISTITFSLLFGSHSSAYHWSLGFRSFLHRRRYSRPQFVEHDWGLYSLPFEICTGSRKLVDMAEEATNPSNTCRWVKREPTSDSASIWSLLWLIGH